MSGKHRRPEPDALPDVDLAGRLTPGPPVSVTTSAPTTPTTPTTPTAPTTHSVPTAPAAAVPGRTVVSRRTRAAERAARRRQARQRVTLVAAGVAVVVLVAAVAVLLSRGDDATPGPGAGGPGPQLTTLVQVTGADGTAAASALLGTSRREGRAVSVLVPSRLIVDVAGSGDMPFGEAVTLPEASASAGALTDLLGVRVEDSWVLTPEALAALVDAVGGVSAAVDVNVVETDAQGNETVVVQAGNQQLSGRGAAAYATYLAPDEPEQARLARFDDVLTGLAERLPTDNAGVVAVLAQVAAGTQSTLDSTALAERLRVFGKAVADEELVSDVLPVTEIDTGGAVTAYGVDSGQAAAMMRSRFAGALVRDAGGQVVRVLVENGLGTPGLVEAARGRLVGAGFRFINGGNASPFTQDPSVVLVPDGTDKSLDRGRRVAAALGLPEASVQPSDRGQNVADVIVILGADFRP